MAVDQGPQERDPPDLPLLHGRCVTFRLAEVAIPRVLFADIQERIDRLKPAQAPT